MSTPRGPTKLHNIYNRLHLHERVVVWVLAAALAVSAVSLAGQLQTAVSTRVPDDGGHYKEGIVGFPRYVNPVLASTNADRDVTSLVYAGLMKKNQQGKVVPDLASRMQVNDNHTKYTFTIDRNATFHDGHPVTAEDVAFTIKRIKDPQINSPRRGQWQNVSVEVVNKKTVRFTTEEPFVGLPANATVGILPKHLWQSESDRSFAFSRLNIKPVGAGPFKVKSVTQNSNGVPTRYTLTGFRNYTGGSPHINKITLRFFADNQSRRTAFKHGSINSMYGLDPAYAAQLKAEDTPVVTRQYNRVFSVFFNQDQNKALASNLVRKALSASIPKETIVSQALAGYGTVVDGPLPPTLSLPADATGATSSASIKPENLLADAGWATTSKGIRNKDGNKLKVTLTTADLPSLQKAANLIKQSWQRIGVKTTIQTLPSNQLTREVIRPRDYEALLFGQSLSSRRDLYAFWHSSRQDDPGLNLARYTNSDADAILESLRTASTTSEARKLTQQFLQEIHTDQPAAFLFSPSFTMVTKSNIRGLSLPPITYPADRFANVSNWYMDTEQLWNIFVDDKRKQVKANLQ